MLPNDPSSLKGSLILADPKLSEPTFCQSVLLLTEHDKEFGAHGYILNRPLGKTVGDLLTEKQFEPIADLKVYVGGPVSTEHLTFSSMAWSPAEGKLQFNSHLSAQQAVRDHLEGFQVRAFVGYSGWSEGQLEGELENHAWMVHEPIEKILDPGGVYELWKSMLRDMSPWHQLVADQPDDLSLN